MVSEIHLRGSFFFSSRRGPSWIAGASLTALEVLKSGTPRGHHHHRRLVLKQTRLAASMPGTRRLYGTQFCPFLFYIFLSPPPHRLSDTLAKREQEQRVIDQRLRVEQSRSQCRRGGQKNWRLSGESEGLRWGLLSPRWRCPPSSPQCLITVGPWLFSPPSVFGSYSFSPDTPVFPAAIGPK